MARNPVELASDIGAKAHDLYQYGDRSAVAALRVIAQVNPEMLAWLRDRLLDITQQRTVTAAKRAEEHGRACEKKPHTGTGHLHGEDDDTPYDVDGVKYCGRCHMAL